MKTLTTALACSFALVAACSSEKNKPVESTTISAMPKEAPPRVVTANVTANGEPVAANNTAVNQRDQGDDFARTADSAPMQGTDMELTASVRKAVIGDSQLSMSAKNVKIIVKDGRVLLRGPVDSAAERQRVYSLAVGLVGSNRVDNELEVAP